MFITASGVPLLTFISSAVVPAVFNPACVVAVNMSAIIALLEFAGAVVPVAFLITCESVFNLLSDFILLELFKLVPCVESPVILRITVCVGICAFIWKNDVV